MDKIASNKLHWAEVSSYEDNWEPRAKLAATLIPPRSSVCDIGCGPKFPLEKHLVDVAEYRPCDMKIWDDRVEYCELNQMIWPERAASSCDTVVLLGVIEYLTNPPATFDWIGRTFPKTVFSYCASDLGTERFDLWISSLTVGDIFKSLRAVGFPSVKIVDFAPQQVLFYASH